MGKVIFFTGVVLLFTGEGRTKYTQRFHIGFPPPPPPTDPPYSGDPSPKCIMCRDELSVGNDVGGTPLAVTQEDCPVSMHLYYDSVTMFTGHLPPGQCYA